MWFDNTRDQETKGDQIEVLKIEIGYEDIDRNVYFKHKDVSRTRGHKTTLVKELRGLDIKQY